MTAATVADLLTRDLRDDRGDRPILVDATGREYDYHWLCTSSWKAGNFLRHSGVREGVTVGVVGDGPLALLAFFGTALLEGTTQFEPPTDLADADAFRALVAPTRDLESEAYDLPKGAQRVGYGAKPEEPDIHNFDAGLWSENPSFPPLSIEPETAILTDGERTVTHADALATARGVIDDVGLEAGDRVVVRESLADPRTVVAGVLAPLLAEGVIVLTGAQGDPEDAGDAGDISRSHETDDPADTAVDRGAYAVSSGADSVPESTRIDLESVPLR